jgi:uncharacterized protein YdeI (YjbR/CyaY-like superfamily)
MAAFAQRSAANSGVYSYEQRKAAALDEAEEQRFRANQAAWEYFQAQPPSYRGTAIWWVVSAKKEATRRSRLARLIDDSQHGRAVPPLARPQRR